VPGSVLGLCAVVAANEQAAPLAPSRTLPREGHRPFLPQAGPALLQEATNIPMGLRLALLKDDGAGALVFDKARRLGHRWELRAGPACASSSAAGAHWSTPDGDFCARA
jgi:hypothetical protein